MASGLMGCPDEARLALIELQETAKEALKTGPVPCRAVKRSEEIQWNSHLSLLNVTYIYLSTFLKFEVSLRLFHYLIIYQPFGQCWYDSSAFRIYFRRILCELLLAFLGHNLPYDYRYQQPFRHCHGDSIFLDWELAHCCTAFWLLAVPENLQMWELWLALATGWPRSTITALLTIVIWQYV